MHRLITGLVLVFALLGNAAAQQVDQKKLRQLVKLPGVQLEYGIGFSGRRGFVVGQEQRDVPAEIAALRKTLRGNPTDAQRHHQLGVLYTDLREKAQADAAFAQAVALYRQQVKTRPGDGRLLARFGEALADAELEAEAERILRRAVKTAPRETAAWITLGQFLQRQSTEALLEGKSEDVSSFPDLLTRVLVKRPAPGQVRNAQRLLDEARAAFDKATAVAPNDPQPYSQRGLFRTWEGFVRGLLRALQDDGQDLDALKRAGPDELFRLALTPAALSDFKKVARLRPDDSRAIAAAALFEVMEFFVRTGRPVGPSQEDVWKLFPEETRNSLRGAMDRLEKLSQRPGKEAAPAAEALGSLRYAFLNDRAGAEASLRRATRLYPSRDFSWDLLSVLLMESERYPELVTLCEERLKQKDTARNHIMLAKAHEKLNHWEQVEEQVRAALKLEPEDFTANLGLAAVLIRAGEGQAALREAGQQLRKALNRIPQRPERGQVIDYSLTFAIFLALDGNTEAAEQQLKRVLDLDRDNEAAKAALQVIRSGTPTNALGNGYVIAADCGRQTCGSHR